ncbi:predicted protein [Sclerotinia sclerotiorum 1980 UF-70]|uniref:Uncharacterized protein n=2 Tax=Sclerotinia sclerotiorum (strain ATCC 18683 / 1980 / Ss-1) TaxID=665079 RepID=A7E8N8_SCLS1|nr:predicted protein [Sclerotinia sclerotiorum 1980 UF-70]APA05931.1 hypothetical protein sscle_01g007010 [Sclerotinia sclerotiorum 1980 UF-70]EDN96740.1 predicted protein [Sclerotinia sclerotiorum 1980 UF-70]
MSDPNIKERTVKQVDVDHKIEINLPANAPSGKPHIIMWDAVKRDNIPHDLSTVDVIVTVLFELNLSALAHLFDTQIEQFYCWWKGNDGIEDLEDTEDDSSDGSGANLPY